MLKSEMVEKLMAAKQAKDREELELLIDEVIDAIESDDIEEDF